VIAVFCSVGGCSRNQRRYGDRQIGTRCLIAFVNKMDRTGANYKVYDQMRDRLRLTVAIQLPIGSESDFRELLTWCGCEHTYTTMTRELISRKPTFQPRYRKWRKNIAPNWIEAVAETDEALIEKQLKELTEAETPNCANTDDCASAVWLCLQKQRRPVDVGCGCRLLTCTN